MSAVLDVSMEMYMYRETYAQYIVQQRPTSRSELDDSDLFWSALGDPLSKEPYAHQLRFYQHDFNAQMVGDIPRQTFD